MCTCCLRVASIRGELLERLPCLLLLAFFVLFLTFKPKCSFITPDYSSTNSKAQSCKTNYGTSQTVHLYYYLQILWTWLNECSITFCFNWVLSKVNDNYVRQRIFFSFWIVSLIKKELGVLREHYCGWLCTLVHCYFGWLLLFLSTSSCTHLSFVSLWG